MSRHRYLSAVRFGLAVSTARGVHLQRGCPCPPIDPFGVTTEFGWLCCASERAAPIMRYGQVDDAVTFACGGKRYIVYNAHQQWSRIRFSIAHEIGHILLGHFDDFDITWLTDKRTLDQQAEMTLWRLEREAYAFAAEFLMPERTLRCDAATRGAGPLSRDALCALAQTYDVSLDAMIIRLDELGIQHRRISHWQCGAFG